jgi:hypothetical protein
MFRRETARSYVNNITASSICPELWCRNTVYIERISLAVGALSVNLGSISGRGRKLFSSTQPVGSTQPPIQQM